MLNENCQGEYDGNFLQFKGNNLYAKQGIQEGYLEIVCITCYNIEQEISKYNLKVN